MCRPRVGFSAPSLRRATGLCLGHEGIVPRAVPASRVAHAPFRWHRSVLRSEEQGLDLRIDRWKAIFLNPVVWGFKSGGSKMGIEVDPCSEPKAD